MYGIIVGKSNTMTTVYFDFSLFPEDFVRRNRYAYDTKTPHFTHSAKLYDSYINKGDEILQISFETTYPYSDFFSLRAPISGYIHYNPKADFLYCTKTSGKAKVCDIYDSFEDLANECFPTEAKLSNDDFTGEEVLSWNKVAGRFSMGFSVDRGCVNLSLIAINKVPYLGVIPASDKLLLLFENQQILEYNLNAYERWQGHIALIPLTNEEILLFSESPLCKVRIISGETPSTFEITGIQKPLFKLYVKKYLAQLAKLDIDWRSIKKPTIEETTIDDISPKEEACYVYLMWDTTNGFHKIGISNNPRYRERTLQSEKPTIELLKAKQYPTRLIAEAIEAALHKAYADKRLRGEWFNLSPSDIEHILETLS